MALIRWEPVPSRLFTSLFDTPTAGVVLQRRFAPATDLVESDTHYILRADLPGVSEQDIDVQLDGNVLSISGERRAESRSDDRGVHRHERVSGSFRRTVRLPEGVEADAIEANFDRGVLEVSISKPVAVAPHRIAVTSGPTSRAVETPHTGEFAGAGESPEPAESGESPVADGSERLAA